MIFSTAYVPKKLWSIAAITLLSLLAIVILPGPKVHADNIADYVPAYINSGIASECSQGFSVVQVEWTAPSSDSSAASMTIVAGSEADLSVYYANYRCKTSYAVEGASFFNNFTVNYTLASGPTPAITNTDKNFLYPPNGTNFSHTANFGVLSRFTTTAINTTKTITATITSSGTVTYSNVGSYCAKYENSDPTVHTTGPDDFRGCISKPSNFPITVTVSPPPTPPKLDGIKISDTGAQYDLVTPPSTTDGSGAYPFSDDVVNAYANGNTATVEHTAGENPFYFYDHGAYSNGGNQLPAGNYSFGPKATDPTYANNGSWSYLGYTFCQDGVAPCGTSAEASAYLDNPANIVNTATTPFVTISDNGNYSIRLIYTHSTCTITTNPSELEAGDTYTALFDVHYGYRAPDYTGMKISSDTNSNGQSLGYNQTVTAVANNTATHDLTYTTAPPLVAPAIGVYQLTMQLVNGASPAGNPCSAIVGVYDLPYFKVYDGDVRADGDCTNATDPPTDGVIGGWYNTTAQAGAGTFFAAIARGQIEGFASNRAQAGYAGSPIATSFANTAYTAGTDSPTLGGGYGDTNCVYSPTQPSGTTTNPAVTAQTFSIGPNQDGATSYGKNAAGMDISPAVNVQITGGTIGDGKNVGIYVNGNAYITANIAYLHNLWSLGSVPSFVLSVTGNIYIAPGVTQLDGIYVAGGEIYTCSDPSGTAPDPTTSLINCDSQLTVNGAFAAKKVNLMRTYGTLKDSATHGAESSTDPSNARSCANPPPGILPTNTCAGEVFNYSPELFLSSPAIDSDNSGAPAWDTVTSLPPVL